MEVSVIIPMFNAEKTIAKCLDSVLCQLAPERMEVIVINDGSTDASAKIVNSYIVERGNKNIILIEQENKGVSAARNAGIHIAKGTCIAFIDADDRWLPGKLEHQIQALRKYKADFVGALINNFSLGFPYKPEGEIFNVDFKKLMIKLVPSTPTVLFKKELITKAGMFDESQKYGEDGNLWFRFSKVGKMIVLNKTYAIAGDFKPLYGHSGLSANLKKMFEGEKKNLKDVLNWKYINSIQYCIYFIYIFLKYQRRKILVRSKRLR